MKTAMTLSSPELALLRRALIEARFCYCRDMDEHGDDGMETPDPDIKGAMELLGMKYEASDLVGLATWGNGGVVSCWDYHHKWEGNEQFYPDGLPK